MTALHDAKRFLTLRAVGAVTVDEPIELLEKLIRFYEMYGSTDRLIHESVQSRETISLLTRELRESKAARASISEVLSARESELRSAREKIRTLSQTLSQCQTSAVESPGVSRSPELELDDLAKPDFVPCRDERCRRQGLHSVDACDNDVRGRGPRRRRKDSHA